MTCSVVSGSVSLIPSRWVTHTLPTTSVSPGSGRTDAIGFIVHSGFDAPRTSMSRSPSSPWSRTTWTRSLRCAVASTAFFLTSSSKFAATRWATTSACSVAVSSRELRSNRSVSRTRASLGAAAAVASVAAHDLLQRRHAILRNFPVVGHARYLIERIGPELRQYVVAGNDEERPFSRDQRRWVYASAKLENNYFGFGTDNDIEHTPGYVIVNHKTFGRAVPPSSPHAGQEAWVPCAKVLGGSRGRRAGVRPGSVVNISGMSFGALSANAVTALNRGAALAGCLQNTGEGSISPYHRSGGGLVYQVGSGYFGCRDENGRFDLARFQDTVASAPVHALEVKLSQGAKPGLGGLLPGVKVSAEIAAARGVPQGVDCVSPSRHAEFSDVDSMLDWVELLAAETGLPVGIKSAVGDLQFWEDLAERM